jgi:hypothetical protein
MPRPYPEDLRLRVVHAAENGKTTREVVSMRSFKSALALSQTSISVGDRPATFTLSRSAVIGEPCWNPTKPRYLGNCRIARAGVERSAGLSGKVLVHQHDI